MPSRFHSCVGSQGSVPSTTTADAGPRSRLLKALLWGEGEAPLICVPGPLEGSVGGRPGLAWLGRRNRLVPGRV